MIVFNLSRRKETEQVFLSGAPEHDTERQARSEKTTTRRDRAKDYSDYLFEQEVKIGALIKQFAANTVVCSSNTISLPREVWWNSESKGQDFVGLILYDREDKSIILSILNLFWSYYI